MAEIYALYLGCSYTIKYLSLIFYFVVIFLSFIVVVMLKFISYFFSESVFFNREDCTSYECGFEHNNLSRIPFSLRYFLLTLVFLLFDLEIVLLIFVPSFIILKNNLLILLLVFVFLFVLFLGLLYEWFDGSLEWIK